MAKWGCGVLPTLFNQLDTAAELLHKALMCVLPWIARTVYLALLMICVQE